MLVGDCYFESILLDRTFMRASEGRSPHQRSSKIQEFIPVLKKTRKLTTLTCLLFESWDPSSPGPKNVKMLGDRRDQHQFDCYWQIKVNLQVAKETFVSYPTMPNVLAFSPVPCRDTYNPSFRTTSFYNDKLKMNTFPYLMTFPPKQGVNSFQVFQFFKQSEMKKKNL